MYITEYSIKLQLQSFSSLSL